MPGTAATSLDVTVDPELLRLLPQQVGELRLERHSLEPGGMVPRGFSDELGHALLGAANSPDQELSVAWADAAPANAERSLGLTISAFRVRGADAVRLRQIVVGDRAMIPGPLERMATQPPDDGRYVLVRRSLVGATGSTVFLVTFAPEVDLSAPPPEDLGWTAEDLAAALPEADPVGVAVPQEQLPWPGPPRTDAGTAALLPKSISGSPVNELTDGGLAGHQNEVLGLPSYQLWMAGLDPSDFSTAGGYTDDLSNFIVIVTQAPGIDSRTLVGAFVDDFAADLGRTLETVDVDGRPVQMLDNIAIYAQDNVLYTMSYLDIGDPFGATIPPRPPLRDLAIDIIRELP